MSDTSPRIFNVLFLCTGNSARSIIAESVLRKDGGERFRAFSAGSQPKGEVHPLALDILKNYHYPIDGLRSKSWDEFSGTDAPVMDFVFTVCDNAAGEVCPFWPGKPVTAHWGVADPAAVAGPDFDRKMSFIDTLRYMKARIAAFSALPIASLDRASLATKMHEIGEFEGATRPAPVKGEV
jgi:arsenate reductase